MGRERETPAQFFWHIDVQKKWYKLSKLEGVGAGRGNLNKIQKNSYFFFGKPSLTDIIADLDWEELEPLACLKK